MAETEKRSDDGANVMPEEARQRLRKEFENIPADKHGPVWDKVWGESLTPWDRGQPSPALVDLLLKREDLLGSSVVSGEGSESNRRRKRAVVPGCGRGYDVLLLSALGYEAVGLDVSETALKAAKKFAEEDYHKYQELLDSNQGSGSHKFLLTDFFKDDWLKQLGWEDSGAELIYDYTFFCALPPEMRPVWAKRMSQVLGASPDARLVCLEFPSKKDPKTGGPPHGVNSAMYLAHLSRPGEKVPYASDGYVEDTSHFATQNDDALERFAHFQPERTHAVGQGADWISVWRHLAEYHQSPEGS